MKLNPKEFKLFKELQSKKKDGSITPEEQATLDALAAKRNDRGSNDIQWWKNYPELLKDAVNVAFNYIPGTDVKISGETGNPNSLDPGVVAVATVRTTIGRSVSDADPFNAQIRQLWLDMHRKYRGIGTYEKSDLGIAILAINSMFETLAKFERIYGVINSYHIGNRTVPYGLKEALSISDNLEENLADFRYTLNLFITKAKQLCLPKGMSALISDIVSISNVFKDSKNRRAFLFMYDTDLFGIYSPTTFSTGGSVNYAKFSSYQTGTTPGGRAAFTLSDVRTILNAQLGQLLNDDDIARICSDLLAAYGSENVMQLVEVPDLYKVEPVEDYERQLQFHNMTVCHNTYSIYFDNPDITTAADANTIAASFPIVIYQNNNVILSRIGLGENTPNYVSQADGFKPTYASNNGYEAKCNDVIFDTWVDEPGETEIMCGTRYTCICEEPQVVATNVGEQEVLAFGTKVCSELTVYSYTGSAYSDHKFHASVYRQSVVGGYVFSFMKLLQQDWAPIIYVADSQYAVQLFGDVDNFAIMHLDTLSRLHEVALLSGYKIPMVAASN